MSSPKFRRVIRPGNSLFRRPSWKSSSATDFLVINCRQTGGEKFLLRLGRKSYRENSFAHWAAIGIDANYGFGPRLALGGAQLQGQLFSVARGQLPFCRELSLPLLRRSHAQLTSGLGRAEIISEDRNYFR